MSNNTIQGPFGPLQIQNEEVGKLISSNYSLADLDAIRKLLAAQPTLHIRRYSSGGHSAVTVLDITQTLEASIDGLLVYQWDRDNIMQCLAELALAEKPSANQELAIPQDNWKRGLLSSIIHHRLGEVRFLDIIHGRRSGFPSDYFFRPHIRYNPISLYEVGDPWGHGQNDSLSFVNFLLFHALKTGRIQASEWGKGLDFAALLHAYFWKINVWIDNDLGAWEDKVAIHWSSIACVLASLHEQEAFLRTHGMLRYSRDGHDYLVTADGVKEMADKCQAKLLELGTNEFLSSENGETRSSDLAQVNPLLLAAVAGRPLVNDGYTVSVLENIERQLMGHLGIRRYNRDVWDGRVNRYDLSPGQEAQWCHGSPQMSYIYGEMYLRTGEERYYEKQLGHFNRMLASISKRWLVPEAWIVDSKSRQWVPDANEPLAWGQAMAILALVQMQNSLERREALAAKKAEQQAAEAKKLEEKKEAPSA
jgi:hypothetical protein